MIYQLVVYDFRAKRKINYPRTAGTCYYEIMQQSQSFKAETIIIPLFIENFHDVYIVKLI